jgi:DNA-binding response OmpR family regulator
MRLLIAEDDPALGALLQRGMEAEGHQVRLAADGDAAMEAFFAESPDLTILDLNLPRRDGTELLELMRTSHHQNPVLVLTGRQAPETRVSCLELGADDCMFKPFSLAELRARCRALLRRQPAPSLVLSSADIEMDRVARTVRRNGLPVRLTNREYALLEQLLLERGRCVPRAVLLERVWGMAASETNVVDVYINYLRGKLGDRGPSRLIESVRGQGYRLRWLPVEP